MLLDHAEPQEKQRSRFSRPERTGGTLAEDAVLRAAWVAGRAARAADRDRRLAPEVVTALKEAGAARHFVPRRWGGREGGFADLITATALIARQCPSAAWCGMLWAAHGRYAARLPEEGQRELWGKGPDTLIAAALAPPAGAARPVPGGWLLDGRWDCVSGVDFSHGVLLAAPVDDAPGRGRCHSRRSGAGRGMGPGGAALRGDRARHLAQHRASAKRTGTTSRTCRCWRRWGTRSSSADRRIGGTRARLPRARVLHPQAVDDVPALLRPTREQRGEESHRAGV